jgi:hypothetical protein
MRVPFGAMGLRRQREDRQRLSPAGVIGSDRAVVTRRSWVPRDLPRDRDGTDASMHMPNLLHVRSSDEIH